MAEKDSDLEECNEIATRKIAEEAAAATKIKNANYLIKEADNIKITDAQSIQLKNQKLDQALEIAEQAKEHGENIKKLEKASRDRQCPL